jgi:hypothetical protein
VSGLAGCRLTDWDFRIKRNDLEKEQISDFWIFLKMTFVYTLKDDRGQSAWPLTASLSEQDQGRARAQIAVWSKY